MQRQTDLFRGSSQTPLLRQEKRTRGVSPVHVEALILDVVKTPFHAALLEAVVEEPLHLGANAPTEVRQALPGPDGRGQLVRTSAVTGSDKL